MLTLGYLTSANWSMSMAASSADLYAVEDQALSYQPAVPATANVKPVPRARWQHGIGNWLVGALGAHRSDRSRPLGSDHRSGSQGAVQAAQGDHGASRAAAAFATRQGALAPR